MLLRLATQLKDTGLETYPDFEQGLLNKIPSIIRTLLPPLKSHRMRDSQVSPLTSPTGNALVYVLATLTFPSASFNKNPLRTGLGEDDEWKNAIKTLRHAVKGSIEAEDSYGGKDELLYGRAGLLWAMLNLRLWVNENATERAFLAEGRKHDLRSIAGADLVEEMFTEIVESGDGGAQIAQSERNMFGLPMIWKWHGTLYLGA